MLGIELAKKYIGLDENIDRTKLKALFKRVGLVLDPATTAWCAGFMHAMEVLTGHTGTGKLNARSYEKYGVMVPEDEPLEHGDILVFERGNDGWSGHVTYFDSWEGDLAKCLGGNQDNKVCYALHNLDKLLSARRSI